MKGESKRDLVFRQFDSLFCELHTRPSNIRTFVLIVNDLRASSTHFRRRTRPEMPPNTEKGRYLVKTNVLPKDTQVRQIVDAKNDLHLELTLAADKLQDREDRAMSSGKERSERDAALSRWRV